MNIIPQVTSKLSLIPETFEKVFENKINTDEFNRFYIPNFILTILTLGFYRFWAKTRNRQYLFSHFYFRGEPFHYSGTAKELLRGFLIVFCFIFLPFFILPNLYLNFAGYGDITWFYVLQASLLFILYPIAVYRSYRYLLSRLSWRGIRFSLGGTESRYFVIWAVNTILTALSLGLAYPHKAAETLQYQFSQTRFGSLKTKSELSGKKLYGGFFKSVGLFIILMIGYGLLEKIIFNNLMEFELFGETFGIILATFSTAIKLGLYFSLLVIAFTPFRYALIKETVKTTTIAGAKFQFSATYSDYQSLSARNTLLMIFSLGFAFPIVANRTLSFIEQNFEMSASENIENAIAVTVEQSGDAEGLGDILDVGAF